MTRATLLIVASVSLLSGCRQARQWAFPEEEKKYELRQDDHGHVVRLNKVSGEISVAIAGAAGRGIPAQHRSRARPAGASSALNDGPSDAIAPPPSLMPMAPGVTNAAAPILDANAPLAVIARSPLYTRPNDRGTPLLTMPVGTPVRLISVSGDWYQVEVGNRDTGERLGFVARSNVAIDDGHLHPVDLTVRAGGRQQKAIDLSIRQSSPLDPVDPSIGPSNALAPVDLSIRDPGSTRPTPVDLSIRKHQ